MVNISKKKLKKIADILEETLKLSILFCRNHPHEVYFHPLDYIPNKIQELKEYQAQLAELRETYGV